MFEFEIPTFLIEQNGKTMSRIEYIKANKIKSIHISFRSLLEYVIKEI
jgi:hypothetical protein